MRERVYVPERIKSPGTEEAVAILADALWRSGACDYADAKERICRLLGWMCARGGDESGHEPYSRKQGGLMNIKTKLSPMAYLPERAHDTDAGADIRTPEGFTLKAHDSEIVSTGVHVQLPPNTVGMLKSKSGLNIKHGIVSEGVIDEGFSGEVMVKLYNLSDQDHRFERGDKITQLVIMPVRYVTYEMADEIQGGTRGSAGYGSTGR